MLTTTKFRLALTAAALCCSAAAADAKPRRLVVLDFDGPRTLADDGRAAVVSLLGDQYDIVAKTKWEAAQSSASKNTYGPQTWRKAAKASGVDAVIEGWVEDAGRHKVLNISVREASTGREFDTLTFKIGKAGLTDDVLGTVRTSLDDVLDYIEGGFEPSPDRLPEVNPRRMIDAKQRRRVAVAPEEDDVRPRAKQRLQAEDDEREDDDRAELERPRARPEVATAVDPDARDRNDLVDLLGSKTDEWPLPKQPNHVPQPTPRFSIAAGGYYRSRSITFESEDPQDFLGVGTKGLSVSAAVYPFPLRKRDGALSGIGFSASLHKAPASTVTVQEDDLVADYKIDSGGWDAAVHYRYPLSSLIHIDGHVGYAQDYFSLEQDTTLDVPDTFYKYFWGGANLDLAITERATVGFGAKYLYVVDNGQMSSLDWYGPGTASGYALDGNFLIPLPARLFVQGQINYQKITTEFDAPDLSAEEARSASDSTVAGTVHIGIQF